MKHQKWHLAEDIERVDLLLPYPINTIQRRLLSVPFMMDAVLVPHNPLFNETGATRHFLFFLATLIEHYV